MPTLIACLSSGKGTWTEVNKLINSQPWDKVFLITNQFGKDNYSVSSEKVELIVIDTFKEIPELVKVIKSNLNGRIKDFEVALNLVSGSGNEHMALLEAIMELGLNFRLVSVRGNKLDVFGMNR